MLGDDGAVLEELLDCCPCMWEEALCRHWATMWPQWNSYDQYMGHISETENTEAHRLTGSIIEGSELHCAGRVIDRRHKCSQSDKHGKPSQRPLLSFGVLICLCNNISMLQTSSHTHPQQTTSRKNRLHIRGRTFVGIGGADVSLFSIPFKTLLIWTNTFLHWNYCKGQFYRLYAEITWAWLI